MGPQSWCQIVTADSAKLISVGWDSFEAVLSWTFVVFGSDALSKLLHRMFVQPDLIHALAILILLYHFKPF